jgi:hypothetical protein
MDRLGRRQEPLSSNTSRDSKALTQQQQPWPVCSLGPVFFRVFLSSGSSSRRSREKMEKKTGKEGTEEYIYRYI